MNHDCGCVESRRLREELATLREMATEGKIRFTVVRWAAYRAQKPRAPKKKTAQKQLGLFE